MCSPSSAVFCPSDPDPACLVLDLPSPSWTLDSPFCLLLVDLLATLVDHLVWPLLLIKLCFCTWTVFCVVLLGSCLPFCETWHTHTNNHFYCHKHGRKMSQHFIRMFRLCRRKRSWKMSRDLINSVKVGCHKQLAMTPDLLPHMAGKCLLYFKVLVDFQLQVGELLTIYTCTNTRKQLGIMGLTHSWCVGKNWRNMLWCVKPVSFTFQFICFF